MSTTSDRGVDVHRLPLQPLPLDPDDVLAGAPQAAAAVVGDLAGVEVGVWSLTEGTVRDVEADEYFLVLAGEATVTFADGERLDLTPGRLVRLHAGERTTWEVRSPLRKVYLTT
ncbi:cupin domain-containing protein [Nocardioides limicola]|uniref:cupin domain-containing protein n=1 Tax=Nocardioides limicola TaxID=2803368 RepID=UPI00193B40DA|nr:cupin domain-containing protein [Nocardioides sp. DJM-14]